MATTTITADMLTQMAKDLDGLRDTRTFTALMSKSVRDQIITLRNDSSPRIDSPLLAGTTQHHLFGMPVVVADVPPLTEYDWSGCRSPSRAKRRHARGIPQRVKVVKTEVAYLIDQAALSMRRELERRAVKILYGE